jgi:hypothetical protein
VYFFEYFLKFVKFSVVLFLFFSVNGWTRKVEMNFTLKVAHSLATPQKNSTTKPEEEYVCRRRRRRH